MPHISLSRALSIVVLAILLTAFPAFAQLPILQSNDITVSEGNAGSTDAVLTVTLSAAATGVVTAAYATEPADTRPATGGASCSGNADYVTESGTVQFSPGQTSQPIGVAVCGDTAIEENERFLVRLSNPVGATIQDATGRVVVTNDDAAQPALPSVSIDDVSVPEGNSGAATRNATVRLSATTTQPVTVVVSIVAGGSATGGTSCLAGVDFLASAARTLTINAGQSAVAVPFAICGDTAFEPTENFLVSVAVETPAVATLGDGSGQLTISNDDPEPITVSVRDTTISEGDLGTPEGKYTLTLSRAAAAPVRVDLAVQGGTATFGSGCTSGADFQSVQVGTVEFSPGQTSRQASFAICSDLNAESDEAFSVTLARPSGAVLGDAVGQVTIKNDDIAGQVVPRDEDVVVRVDPARAELEVELVALPTQTAPNLAFGVRARNTGVVTASNVPVRFQLPKDVAFAGLEENTMGSCLQNSTSADGALQVNCTVPSLPAGGNRGVRILGRTPASAVAGSTEVVYSAAVDPGNTIPEGNDLNNLVLGRATVLTPADLQVAVARNGLTFVGRTGPSLTGDTALDFSCIPSGTQLGVSLTVSNLGPNRTPSGGIVASWPSGFVSLGSACFEFCAVPALSSGQSATVNLAGLWNVESRFASGDVTFKLDAAFDPTPANNTATVRLSLPKCGG